MVLRIIHSPGIVPGAESFEFSGYIPGSDITVFGTEWTHNQGTLGAPFGPPGFPASNRADGFAAYAAKSNLIVASNTFRYGAAVFAGGVPVLGPVTPAASYRCTVQLAALFVAPPTGTFSASITDSTGQQHEILPIAYSELPPFGVFGLFDRDTVMGSTGQPANEIRITAANNSNPPGSYIACSFVGFVAL